MTFGVLAKKFEIKMAVFGVEKDVTAPIAALGNMMSHSRNHNTRSPHDLKYRVASGGLEAAEEAGLLKFRVVSDEREAFLLGEIAHCPLFKTIFQPKHFLTFCFRTIVRK